MRGQRLNPVVQTDHLHDPLRRFFVPDPCLPLSASAPPQSEPIPAFLRIIKKVDFASPFADR